MKELAEQRFMLHIGLFGCNAALFCWNWHSSFFLAPIAVGISSAAMLLSFFAAKNSYDAI